jgi:HEAT repeat protein
MRSILTFFIVILAFPAGVFAQNQQPSLDDLILIVSGKDSVKSAEAIIAIGKLKPTSDSVIQTLVNSLADDRRAVYIPDYVAINFPVDTVGTTAADALAEIGRPAVSRICEFLSNNNNTEVRKLAIRSLSKMEADAADAVPVLERLLREPHMEMRFEAVAALASVQKNPRSLSSALGTVLSDISPDVRTAAIRALGNIGEAGSRNAPRLLNLLDDTENRWHFYTPDMVGTRPVRYDSAMALAGTGNDARLALVKLREMMSGDSDSLVRVAAAFAIAKLDNASKDAIDFLIAAVQDSEKGYAVTEAAVEVLGKLGPKAEAALQVLGDALKHPETMVRIHAVEAIVLISPETAETRLLMMLNDEDALVRASAIESLGAVRNPSPQLLNSCIAALDDTDSIIGTEVRHAAAVALGNLQEKAVTAIPRLRRVAQEEEDDRVKDAAVKAVLQITQGQTESDRTKR